MGAFFLEFYQNLYPIRQFFTEAARRGVDLKWFVIIARLSNSTKIHLENIMGENIKKDLDNLDLESADIQLFSEKVYRNLNIFTESFTPEYIRSCNTLWLGMTYMQSLSRLHYPEILKQFNPTFTDGDFDAGYSFQFVPGRDILPHLEALLNLLPLFPESVDWKLFLELFRKSNVPVPSEMAWEHLIKQINLLKEEDHLLNILRYITENPFFPVAAGKLREEDITKSYLTNIKTHTKEVLESVIADQRRARNITEAQKLFAPKAFYEELSFYNERYFMKAADNYHDRTPLRFRYITFLNTVYLFLKTIYKEGTDRVIDPLLIRGKWSDTKLQAELSNGHYELREYQGAVLELDHFLDEQSPLGQRFFQLLRLKKSQPHYRRNLSRLIMEIDGNALQILKSFHETLSGISRTLRTLVIDYRSKEMNFITNWKELHSGVIGTSPMDHMTFLHRKITDLVHIGGIYGLVCEEEQN